MSEKKVKVTYNKLEVKEFPVGTSLKQISKSFQNYFDYFTFFEEEAVGFIGKIRI